MSKAKTPEHAPKHGVIRCKGHAPKHLPFEAKKERSGWWMLFAAIIYAAANVFCAFFYIPNYVCLPAGIALLIISLLKVTKKATFPRIASLVISALGMIYNLFCVWFFCLGIMAFYL